MTIDNLISRIEKLSIKQTVEDGLEATKEELIKLQRLQMLKGERSDGKKIGKYKNDRYAAKKAAQNPLAGFGNIDLKLTGDTHAAIFADVRENSVVIDSADMKTLFLVERFGESIFGLKPENASEYSLNYLGPDVTKRIVKKLHG